MNNKFKKLAKIVAALAMCVTFALPLAACDPEGGHTHVDTDGDKLCDVCKQPMDDTADKGDGENENPNPTPGTGDEDGPNDPPKHEEEEPEIPKVPAGAVKIKEAAGDLEACYVTWEEVEGGAKTYSVYIMPENGTYTKLDRQLVRKYSSYYRADAVGLKAGKYTMKVVPVGSDDNEVENLAGTAIMTVVAHERAGFAFVGGTSSGAYNEDGTLKENANVVYITDNNKDSVSLEMKSGTVTGLQNILDAQKNEGKPLAVRLIGSISAPDNSGSSENKNPNTLLIKGKGKGDSLAITLEGIGSDATANGWTLRITSSTNVEIRNIGFMNTKASEPDDVTLEKDDHVWVHNCDLFYGGAGGDSDQAKGDGALDTKESSYITHSYNHFWDSGKCNLQNMHESGDWRITYHHNWYDHSDSRHPRIRSATVHVYNNYFDGNAKYGVGACEGASVFVENNYFRSTVSMKPMMSSKQGTDLLHAEGGNPDKGTFSKEDGGMIKAYGNKFDGKYELITQKDTSDKTNLDCYLATSREEQVSGEYKTKYGSTTYNNFDTATDMYKYEVDSPELAKLKVEKYAGRVGGGDFKWEFDNATEDGNSSIIVALKTALTNYKSDLVSVDGEVIVGGSTGGSTGGGTDGPIDVTGLSVIIFSNGVKNASGEAISGVTVSGNYNSSGTASSFTFNGVEYTKPLKMESSTSVKINFEQSVKLTICVSVANAKIKVNGTAYTSDANKKVTVTVQAGEFEITKGDQMDLWYILLEPVE